MKAYNKLIRDKIPEIIEATGRKAVTRVLDEAEYRHLLDVKLQEELKEYLTANQPSDQIAELADLVEVVYAILACHGVTLHQFEQIRLEKKVQRGGFDDRLLLVRVEEPGEN